MPITDDGEVGGGGDPIDIGDSGGGALDGGSNPFGYFSRVHADQYPYNSHTMLAMLVRKLLGIKGDAKAPSTQEVLKIHGLKADPKLPAELAIDPDIAALAVREKNIPYAPGATPSPRIPYGASSRRR